MLFVVCGFGVCCVVCVALGVLFVVCVIVRCLLCDLCCLIVGACCALFVVCLFPFVCDVGCFVFRDWSLVVDKRCLLFVVYCLLCNVC